jgi:hypothetical protein
MIPPIDIHSQTLLMTALMVNTIDMELFDTSSAHLSVDPIDKCSIEKIFHMIRE